MAFNYLDPTTRKVLPEYLEEITIQDAANARLKKMILCFLSAQ